MMTLMTMALWMKSPKAPLTYIKLYHWTQSSDTSKIFPFLQPIYLTSCFKLSSLAFLSLPQGSQAKMLYASIAFSFLNRHSQWKSHRFRYPNLKLISDLCKSLSSSLLKKFLLQHFVFRHFQISAHLSKQ
jgi:hypothetical protein